MSNNYFGFTGATSQYGASTGYTATNTATGYGQPSQQQAYPGHSQAAAQMNQRQYPTAYDTQYHQQYATQAAQAQSQRYDAAKATQASYYSQTTYAPQHQQPDQSAAHAAAAAYQQSMARPTYPGQGNPASTYNALRTVTPAANTAQTATPKSYSVYSSQAASAYGSYSQPGPATNHPHAPHPHSAHATHAAHPHQHANNKPVPATAGNNWTAAAIYAAAANMPSQAGVSVGVGVGTGVTGIARKPGLGMKPRPKMPPKPQQLHYCEVCKISCAGPQTYKEHLEGQKHKKKEAAAKTGQTQQQQQQVENKSGRPASHGTSLRCELCDVTCTGADAYAAHIRGAKHQKVVKLHTKLGKPIPSTDPVILAGSRLLRKDGEEPKEGTEDKKITLADIVEQDVQPVGQEYIEELRNNEGKVISFQCKLCDCKFSDPNAKEMHMKGRRHRLQFKKKVNPDLVVDIKPSLRRGLNGRHFRERDDAEWDRAYSGPPDMMMLPPWGRPPRGPPPHPMLLMLPPPFRRPDTPDDRHILAKHSKIFPPEEELAKIQKLVAHTERALKGVSDRLAGSADTTNDDDKTKESSNATSTPAAATTEAVDVEEKKDHEDDACDDKRDEDSSVPQRQLRGVMRVGMFAKGLLLTGDTQVGLVVLSGDKPTTALLHRVADLLPEQLEKAVDANDTEKYTVTPAPEEASIFVRTVDQTPQLTVKVTLTSPVMRDSKDDDKSEDGKDCKADSKDVLNKDKCLEALAALRHAKWFQARASSLQSCVMLVRIFRDLCNRVPTWANIDMWALELLIEKVIASADMPLHPGDALRRVLEALAFGILLPGGPGLHDPCEKQQSDALANMKLQDREDITASAQHALRLIAFRQIHKVLGMEPLPPPKFKQNFNRKRRLDNSSESGEADGKKDKKEEETKKDQSSVSGASSATTSTTTPTPTSGQTAVVAS